MSYPSKIPSLLGPSLGGGMGMGMGGGLISQDDYKVSSNTNSTDPEAVNSRVFVGGLNTTQLTKTDVAQIFKRYGRVTAVSIHKGFAFVQFMDPQSAQQACLGEDQRVYANQTIDVNLVSEPKFNRQKKANPVKAITSSQSAQRENNVPVQPAVPGKKVSLPDSSQMMKYNTPDILICGTCKSMFQGIEALGEHKNRTCQLKPASSKPEGGSLQCATCLIIVDSAWSLIQHCQRDHGVIIFDNYELPDQQANGNGMQS